MAHPRPRSRVHLMAAALTAAVIFATTAIAGPTRAQLIRGISSFQETLRPEYLPKDLDVFTAELSLDAEQQIIVEALLRDYAEAFATQAKVVGDRIQEIIVGAAPAPDDASHPRGQYEALLQEASDRAAAAETPEERERIVAEYQERLARAREAAAHGATVDVDASDELRRRVEAEVEPWRATRTALGAELVDNVQPLLRDPQMERWPSLERHLRRLRLLRDGKLSGETADLVAMVGDVETDDDFDRAALGPSLDTYAIELDAALRVRSDVIAAVNRADAADNALEQEIVARVAVRDVNLAWIERFVDALPETPGAALRSTFNKATYPLVERPTPMTRIFDSVAKRITDEDRADAIAGLRAAYDAELAAENEKIRTAIRMHDPERLRRRISVQIGTAAGPPPVDPIELAFDERRAVSDRYAGELSALLTEEELGMFPALRRDAGAQSGGVRNGLEQQAWVMEKFDTNGDGKLDADEMEAVRAHLREER